MTTTKIPTEQEIRRQLRIKAVELAIKASVGKNGSQINTVMNNAKEIFKFLTEEEK